MEIIPVLVILLVLKALNTKASDFDSILSVLLTSSVVFENSPQKFVLTNGLLRANTSSNTQLSIRNSDEQKYVIEKKYETA